MLPKIIMGEFTEQGPSDCKLQPSFDDYLSQKPDSEDNESDVKSNSTIRFLESLDLDDEVKPYIRKAASICGFHSLLRLGTNYKERVNQQIKDVQLSERVFSKGDKSLQGKYIPVGATYINSEEGMLVLHQSVDLKNNRLGNDFYLTNHILKTRETVRSYAEISSWKFSLDNMQNLDEGVDLISLNKEERRRADFQYRYQKVSALHSYGRVQELHFVGSPEIRQNVLKFISTKYPDRNILIKIHSLMKEAE